MSRFVEKYFIFIVISLVIIMFIVFKLTIGKIEINTTHTYLNPVYKLYINEKEKGLSMEMKESTTIIPFTLSRVKIEALSVGDYFSYIDLSDKINIKIIGYNCYTSVGEKNIQTKCNGSDTDILEIDDIKFDRMTIYNRVLKGHDKKYMIYDGEYTNDLNSIITKSGDYTFVVKLHHDKIESVLQFAIIVK